MAVTIVQSVLGAGNGAATTATATFSSAVTAGNVIVVAVIELQTAPAVTTCTDNATGGSNTYTLSSGFIQHAGNQTAELSAQFCYCLSANAGGAKTVTVGWGGTGVACQIMAYELTPGQFLSTQTGSSANTSVPDSGSYTPALNGAVIIGCGALNDNVGATSWCSAGTSFTLDGQDGTTGGGLNSSWAYEHWAQTSAAAADATYTSLHPAQTGPAVASLIAFGPNATATPELLLLGCGSL